MTRGNRRISCFLCIAATLALSGSASAQTSRSEGTRVEAMVTVGWGRVWRHRSGATRFGSGPNIGGSLVVRAESGLAVSVDVHRTLGVASAPTAFSTNLRYYFRSTDRVQPYVIAGLGVLRIDRRGLPASAGRADSIDVGFGPNLGAGLAFVDDRFVAAIPEVQWVDGTWRSPLNLSVTRFTGGAGYSW
jgi:opacity protein-like surface antigen